MINDVEHPTFDFPVRSVSKTITSPDGTTTQEKNDEMDIYVWRKDYELVHGRKAESSKKKNECFR